MTPEAGVARAPSQPCAGEAPVLQGQKSRFVPWPLKRLHHALSPHLATDFSHHRGIGWEDGIDSNKTLAYFILIPRAIGVQRGRTQCRLKPSVFLMEVTGKAMKDT